VNEILLFRKCVKTLDLVVFISLPNLPCVAPPSLTTSFLFLLTSETTTKFLCLGTLVPENTLFFVPYNQFNFAKVVFSSLTNTSN
jgi:hypothetical protein